MKNLALDVPEKQPKQPKKAKPLPVSPKMAHKKPRKGNSMGHTAKEKLRRANIVNSCNAFRYIVPGTKVGRLRVYSR